MSQTPVAITAGSGSASVAAELVNGTSFQQIEVYGQGGASVLGVNPDGSIKASIIGTPSFTMVGSPSISGTVVATQGTTPWVISSVYGNFSGSVVGFQGGVSTSSIVSSTPSSVLVGASIFGQLPGGTATLGSVAALQGTNPWVITGSVQATAVANQSVSGTVGASVVGTVPVTQTTSPWIITGSVQATAVANQSVSGTVNIGNTITVSAFTSGASILGSASVFQAGTWNVSVVGMQGASVSGTVGASIIGQLPAGTAPIGSVATLQGTNPWNVAGSVAAFQAGTQITSVSGAVTPYSIPGSIVSGISSVITSSSSVLVVAAPTGVQKNYITHVLVTNGAAVSTTVSLIDNGKVIWSGYAAASGGGWSESFNVPLPQPTSALALYAISSVQASILVGVSGFTAP